MPVSQHVLRLSRFLQQSFPPGTAVSILPSARNRVADAARMAGMNVQFLAACRWPFPDLIAKLERSDSFGFPMLVGQDDINFHNGVRDYIADGINSTPHGVAIKEVSLSATLSQSRAVVDILARAPPIPGDTPQVLIEIKTGSFSEINVNQKYIYALALVGNHVQSVDPNLRKIGLSPGVLPAMDFLLMSVEPPDHIIVPSLLRASSVDQAKSIAQIMTYIAALEAGSGR